MGSSLNIHIVKGGFFHNREIFTELSTEHGDEILRHSEPPRQHPIETSHRSLGS